MVFALLGLALAAPARADVLVGDPGTRSVVIDSTQFTAAGFSTAPVGPTDPFPVGVAADGTFSIPASLLSWAGTVNVAAQQFSQPVGCENFTVSSDAFSQSVSLSAGGDGAGLLNPALNTVHVGLDGSVTAGDITVPIHLDGTGCLGAQSDSGTLSCSFVSVPTHLDLDGDGAGGTNVPAGNLVLSDSSVQAPLTPNCSGGGFLGGLAALVTNYLANFYASAASGAVDLVATMTPGVHSPAPALFAGAPVLTGSPEVGAVLTCTPAGLSGVPAPVLSYSWLRNGAPIDGSSASTYTVQAVDAEQTIACAVNAVNDFGSDGGVSNAVVVARPVAAGPGGSTSATGGGFSTQTSPTGATQRPGATGVRCVVPKLRGLTVKKAKRKLEKAHCRAGKIKKVTAKAKGKTKAVKKGRVVKTKPKAGKRTKAGTRVRLFVAR